MSYTEADLASATAKLASLKFTAAESEAIAAVLAEEPAEVDGFAQHPDKGNGFLLEVSGLMRASTNWSGGVSHDSGFTATDDLASVKK